jgi:hypothetical protein
MAAAATAACASLATAQGILAGVGRAGTTIDVDAATGQIANLGVEYIGNEIFITARGNSGGTTAPHTCYVLDRSGNLLRSFQQAATTNPSAWGWRDPATDGVHLIAGSEGGIDVVDVNGAAVNTVLAANGPQTIVQPITITGVTTCRALAFDPNGNGGNGSLFVGDFAADIVEVSLSGAVLKTYTNTSSLIWSAYGLAYVPATQTLWINSSPDSADIAEYAVDRTASTLTPTGRAFARALVGSVQGGLCVVPGGLDGRNCGFDLLGLDQATPDSITNYRIDLWDNYPSTGEPQLVLGKNNGPTSPAPLLLTSIDTSLQIDHANIAPGAPYVGLFDVAGTYRPAGFPIPGAFKELWEMVEFPSAPVLFTGGTGVPINIPVSALSGVPTGQTFTFQTAVVDLNLQQVPANCGLGLPLIPTNVAQVEWAQPRSAVVSADGANNFTAPNFWQVAAGAGLGTDSIVEVTFDWFASTNTAQATMVFDIDQTGMNDAFWNGNAVAAGCSGTYRGTDAITGLNYSAPQINRVSTCAVAPENSGVEVNNAQAATGTAANNVKTLTWRFTPGQFTSGDVFIVDIDTDGGAGTSGAQMAGMVVTVVTQGGTTFTGELAISGSNRSEIAF